MSRVFLYVDEVAGIYSYLHACLFLVTQTPDGSFYDIIWNAHELLTSCEVDMPEVHRSSEKVKEHIKSGDICFFGTAT